MAARLPALLPLALVGFLAACGADSPDEAPGATSAQAPSATGGASAPEALREVEAAVPSEFRWSGGTFGDASGYPAPIPVQTVAVSAVPRLDAARQKALEGVAAANRAAHVQVLAYGLHDALPGATPDDGEAFLVVDTRWENVHPRQRVSRAQLEGRGDRTFGVAGFASGRAAAAEGDTVEMDVAYQVKDFRNHLWAVVDGHAVALDPATSSVHGGVDLLRPFTLERLGTTASVRFVFRVPKAAASLGLHFFDYTYGHLSLPLDGPAEGAALPPAAGRTTALTLASTGVRQVASFEGVTPPDGWALHAVDTVGMSLSSSGTLQNIVQLDPRSEAWLVDEDGWLYPASGGTVDHNGNLRFPPELPRRQTFVFALPEGARPARMGLRVGRERLVLPLSGVQPPSASPVAAVRDGEHLDVALVSLHAGAHEIVAEVALTALDPARGVEVLPAQFVVPGERENRTPDEDVTLVHGLGDVLIVPPGETARAHVRWELEDLPPQIVFRGASGDQPLATAHAPDPGPPLRAPPLGRTRDLVTPRATRLTPEPRPDARGARFHWGDEREPPRAERRELAPVEGVEVARGEDEDSGEPNDTFERATLIPADGVATGLVSERDRDWHALVVTGAPTRWTVEVEGASATYLDYLEGGLQTPVRDGRLAFDDLFLLPGTHHFRVAGDGPAQPYRLIATRGTPPAPDEEREPNEHRNRAAALPFGAARRGRIANAGDRDVWVFSLAREEHLRVDLEGPPGRPLRLGLEGQPTVDGAGQVSWEGRLPVGQYALTVRGASEGSTEYALRLTRLDPFETAGDLEPNDQRELARPLPVDGFVEGLGGDTDSYRIPERLVGGILDVAFTGEGRACVERRTDEGWDHLGCTSPRRLRAELPRGADAVVRVDAKGTYRLAVGRDGRAAVPRTADIRLTLTGGDRVPAAFLEAGQRLELELGIRGPAGRTLALEGWASDPRWRIAVPGSTVLPETGEATLPVQVEVGADAWADRPVRIAVGAVTPEGSRATATLDVTPGCEASPLPPGDGPLPPALAGGLDVASVHLGAVPVEAGTGWRRVLEAQTGLGERWYGHGGDLPLTLEVDLAGEAPVPIAGFVLDPVARQPEFLPPPPRFAVALSDDGSAWEEVLTGVLRADPVRQAFALPSPRAARFARLTVTGDARTDRVGLGAFHVVADPAWPGPWPEGANVARPELGGHVVYLDAEGSPRGLLDPDRGEVDVRADALHPVTFVIGFHHGREPRLRALTAHLPDAQDGRRKVLRRFTVAAGDGPTGPWRILGEWRLAPEAGSTTWTFDAPVRARYLRFTSTEPQRLETWWVPRIEVRETPPGAGYRSILGEWDRFGPGAAGDAHRPFVALADEGPHGSREEALALKRDADHTERVRLEDGADWYRIDVPEGHNTLALTLQSAELSRLTPYLEGPDGPVRVRMERSGDLLQAEAPVTPGTWHLRIEEPPRAVAFVWDTSGSVGEFLDQIGLAVNRYATGVVPGRERVGLVPFRGSESEMLPPGLTDDRVLLARALGAYPGDASSDAEAALLAATAGLAKAPGSRAIVLITDADSPGAGLTTDLWRAFDEVRPRIFSVQIPVGSTFDHQQDLMEDWSAVDQGRYAVFRTQADLDVAFERATCLLRRPATYTIRATTRHEAPPAPGALLVVGAPDDAYELLVDASGSMHKRLGKSTRIQIAREVLTDLVQNGLARGTPLALRVFGHRQPRVCRTDLEVPLGPADPVKLAGIIGRIDPKDRAGTPIADSLAKVARDLAGAKGRRTVVLVTDGQESCGGDPEAALRELRKAGLDARVEIVGFAIDDARAEAQFGRWAELGGGRYYPAADAQGLKDSLQKAMNPRFEVLDGDGALVAEGVVNGAPVALPPGRVRVRVLSSPVRELETEISSAKETRIDLDKGA